MPPAAGAKSLLTITNQRLTYTTDRARRNLPLVCIFSRLELLTIHLLIGVELSEFTSERFARDISPDDYPLRQPHVQLSP
jgi:hypothetical protein